MTVSCLSEYILMISSREKIFHLNCEKLSFFGKKISFLSVISWQTVTGKNG